MPKYKKKLVVVLSRFPYPLEKGDKLRIYYQLQDLSKYFDIFLFCTTEIEVKTESYQKVSIFCKKVHIFRLNKLFLFFNLFKALFTKKPFQVVYFTQNWIHKKIAREIESIKPDHIYCQLIRPAEYVKSIHTCRKTIDLMDALSKGMERRIESSKWYLKWIFREESKRLKLYETRIIDYFEHVSIISEQDKKYIIHPKNKNINVIPNGVGDSFLNFEKTEQKKYDLLFTGNMSYAPNVQASSFIVKDLLPKIHLIYPTIKVALVGANPSSLIKSFSNESVFVSSWVEDIREYYAQSHIFIAPMFSGSGLQNKILEAMAMGIPCITTSLANNSILAKDGEEIIIAENEREMLEAIQKLKSDLDFYQKIAKNAKIFVTKNYNWQSINENLIYLLEN